jgi:hypothetical protein
MHLDDEVVLARIRLRTILYPDISRAIIDRSFHVTRLLARLVSRFIAEPVSIIAGTHEQLGVTAVLDCD